MSNDEHLADKLTSLLHTALRALQANVDTANTTASFKRLAGTYILLTTFNHTCSVVQDQSLRSSTITSAT